MKIQFANTNSIAAHATSISQRIEITFNQNKTEYFSLILAERRKKCEWKEEKKIVNNLWCSSSRRTNSAFLWHCFERFSFLYWASWYMNFWYIFFLCSCNDTNHFPSLACPILLSAFAFTLSPQHLFSSTDLPFVRFLLLLSVIDCESSLIYN